jgi:hypothetical protein
VLHTQAEQVPAHGREVVAQRVVGDVAQFGRLHH